MRSVKVGCINRDDGFEADKDYAHDFLRLLDDKNDEFVIMIYYGMSITKKRPGNIVCYPIEMLKKRFGT